MYARSTNIQGAPEQLKGTIAYIRDEVMPTMLILDGCIGLSMMVNRQSGRSITTTAWRDQASMSSSEAQVRGLRTQAGDLAGGTPEVQQWEIAALHRTDEAGEGACIRATWSRCDLDRLQQSIDTYRITLLPAMESLPGFRSASLLIDREQGLAVSSVTYSDSSAMDRSRQDAAGLRRQAVQDSDLEILEVVEFELVLAHLRVPETA